MALTKVVNGEEVVLSAQEEAEIRAQWAQEDAIKQDYETYLKYMDDRAREYPPLGDQLDALLKQFNYMRMQGQLDPQTATTADIVNSMNNFNNLVQDLDNIIAAWLAIKAKYPKPGA